MTSANNPLHTSPTCVYREYLHRNDAFRADFAAELRFGKESRISLRVISKEEDDALLQNPATEVHPLVLIKHMPVTQFQKLSALLPLYTDILELLKSFPPTDGAGLVDLSADGPVDKPPG